MLCLTKYVIDFIIYQFYYYDFKRYGSILNNYNNDSELFLNSYIEYLLLKLPIKINKNYLNSTKRNKTIIIVIDYLKKHYLYIYRFVNIVDFML